MTRPEHDAAGDPFDPFGQWKAMREANVDAWSKMMVQLVNTDAYAQTTGAMLDAWLTTSAPFRKAVEAAMTQALVNLNMPTRGDVTALAERLVNIEMRLDDLDAKLDNGKRPARKASGSRNTPASPAENLEYNLEHAQSRLISTLSEGD